MAKRSVLIPEEFYHKFLEFLNNSDVSNLAQSKQSMNKVLRSRSLDPNAKNELVSQHLNTYLRQRREIEDRPMRVVLASPPRSPRSPSPDRPLVSVWRPPSPPIPSTATPSGPIPRPPPHTAPAFSFAPSSSPAASATPVLPRKRKAGRDELERMYEAKADEILSQLDFRMLGIGPNGEFLNPEGKAYRDSRPLDARRAIMELLGKKSTYSLAGGNRVHRAIYENPHIMNEIREFRSNFRKRQRGDGWLLSNFSKKSSKVFVAPRWRVVGK